MGVAITSVEREIGLRVSPKRNASESSDDLARFAGLLTGGGFEVDRSSPRAAPGGEDRTDRDAVQRRRSHRGETTHDRDARRAPVRRDDSERDRAGQAQQRRRAETVRVRDDRSPASRPLARGTGERPEGGRTEATTRPAGGADGRSERRAVAPAGGRETSGGSPAAGGAREAPTGGTNAAAPAAREVAGRARAQAGTIETAETVVAPAGEAPTGGRRPVPVLSLPVVPLGAATEPAGPRGAGSSPPNGASISSADVGAGTAGERAIVVKAHAASTVADESAEDSVPGRHGPAADRVGRSFPVVGATTREAEIAGAAKAPGEAPASPVTTPQIQAARSAVTAVSADTGAGSRREGSSGSSGERAPTSSSGSSAPIGAVGGTSTGRATAAPASILPQSSGSSPSWVEHVAERARLTRGAERVELRLQLEPRGLGRIEVRLHLDGDGLRAVVVAEHEQARALLAGQQNRLEAALAREDLHLSSFELEVDARSHDESTSGEERQLPALSKGASRRPKPAAERMALPRPAEHAVPGRISLRV